MDTYSFNILLNNIDDIAVKIWVVRNKGRWKIDASLEKIGKDGRTWHCSSTAGDDHGRTAG